MSPVIVTRKGTSPGSGEHLAPKTGERHAGWDWTWVGLGVVCTWLLLTGLHRLFGNSPVTASKPPPAAGDVSAQVIVAPPEPPSPTPVPRKVVMHDEAVQATVKSLREHARECPDAPDALSEEQIKDIERRRALIL
ncbi:MAG: hypothetical protein WCS01_06230 [bacterium]